MLKTTLIVCGLALASAGWPMAATAQEAATLVMRNGERLGVELVDLGGVGFTVLVNGQERRVPPGDVAAIEFTGGAPSPQALERLNSGRPVVVLRNGDVIEGRLYDIGGTHPLRITIDTPSGQRDFTSNEVAQIYYTNPGRTVATNGSPAAQAGATTTVQVPANQQWTDTGLTVRAGHRIAFHGRGDIMIAPNASSGVGGSPAVSTGRYPVPQAPVGALIGRVGRSAPFPIGVNTEPITMPAGGRLLIGVNDDNYGDNTGNYTVTITQLGR